MLGMRWRQRDGGQQEGQLSPEGHLGTISDAKLHQREKTEVFLQKENATSMLMNNF